MNLFHGSIPRELRRLGRWFISKHGIEEDHSQNIARLYARDIAPLCGETRVDPAKSRVLLWSPLTAWPHMLIDRAVMTHLRLRGHDIMAAICSGGLPHCEMERANFKRPLCVDCAAAGDRLTDAFRLPKKHLRDYVPDSEIEQIRTWTEGLSADELSAYTYRDIDLGAFAARYITTYYQGFVPLDQALDTARRILSGELLATLYAERVCRDYRPDMVFMLSGALCQYYGAFQLLRKSNVHVVTWDEGNQWKDGFCFNHNATASDILLEDDLWAREKDRPLSDVENGELDDFFDRWRQGTVSARFYHPNPIKDEKTIREHLGLEPGSRVFAAFSNVIWDSNVLTQNLGFTDLRDWVKVFVDWFEAHPSAVLVLRAHPGEVKIYQKEYRTRPDSTLPGVLQSLYPRGLPSNVRVIPAEDDTYSYTLMDIAEGIGVYSSTIGFEAALRGRKPWVAAKAKYWNKGFTLDIQSPNHLRSMLDQPSWDMKLTQTERESCRRFAYLWMFRSICHLPYLLRNHGNYSEVHFKNLHFLKPGGDPVLDAIATCIVEGKPFIDIPRRTNATWRFIGQSRWSHFQGN